MRGGGGPARFLAALLAAAFAAAPLPVLAAPARPARTAQASPVPVRAADHDGFGRIVFDFPRWVGWRLHRHGDRVRLLFSAALPFGPTPRLPRNVLALTDAPGSAEVTVVPGARLRRMRVGARLVLDVLDPPKDAHAARPAALVARRPKPRARRLGVPADLARALAAAGAGPGEAATPVGTAPLALTPAPVAPVRAAPSQGESRAVSATAPTAGVGGAPPDTKTAAGPAPPPSPIQPPQPGAGPAAPISGAATAGVAQAAPAPAASPQASSPQASSPQAVSPSAVSASAAPPGPVALAAVPAPLPPGSDGGAAGRAMLVPFEAGVGAAAFRRGLQAVIVFDVPRPIDLGGLRGDPTFAAAAVRLLPAGTELTLPLPADARVALARETAGWRVAVLRGPAHRPPVRVRAAAGVLFLRAPAPGRVVSLIDPVSGAALLVGTERTTGAALAPSRQAPQFALLSTFQGVAVEALSDRLTLRPRPGGFVLAAAGGALAVTPGSIATAGLADAALLTRRFDLPSLPRAALAARERRELAAAARLPPLARGRALRRAARSMLGLGMAAEAGAVLHLAAEEDPREAVNATHAGLAAIAAMLAGHPRRAGAIEDPRLAGSDETALWRAVRAAMLRPGSPRAAAVFAATAPLILTYPKVLRRRLLPLAAETMIAAGATGPAAKLLALRPHDPALVLARGMLDGATGRTDAALAIYDRLAGGADRLLRFRAARRAVALRLAAKRIDAARAADQLSALRDAWRGGKRELALREEIAGLRDRAGQWRRALALLRGAIADFPAARPRLRARMRAMFAALLADPRLKTMAPLDFVALLDENADLLPKGAAGEKIEAALADRLVALDLPGRAAPVLARLMRAAPTPRGRASFGARLAALRLREDDPAGAARALTASEAADLPTPLEDRRAVLAARAEAGQGNVAGALAALDARATPAAELAAAAIAEQAGDWPAAEKALTAYAAGALPAAGPLTPAQRQLVLRLATATVRAGDEAGLAALRAADAARMGRGSLADMFHLLTDPPVRGLAELPRAAEQAALAGRLGGALKALR